MLWLIFIDALWNVCRILSCVRTRSYVLTSQISRRWINYWYKKSFMWPVYILMCLAAIILPSMYYLYTVICKCIKTNVLIALNYKYCITIQSFVIYFYALKVKMCQLYIQDKNNRNMLWWFLSYLTSICFYLWMIKITTRYLFMMNNT